MLAFLLGSTQQLPGNSQVGLACYVSVCWVRTPSLLTFLSESFLPLTHFSLFPLPSPTPYFLTCLSFPLNISPLFPFCLSLLYSLLNSTSNALNKLYSTLYPSYVWYIRGEGCLRMGLPTEAPFNLMILYSTKHFLVLNTQHSLLSLFALDSSRPLWSFSHICNKNLNIKEQ